MNFYACFDELEKLGAISEDTARASLQRLDQLEKQKPEPRKVLEYGALGAASGPLVSAASDLVKGKVPFEAAQRAGKAISGGRLRSFGGAALGGAIGMGAVPLARYHLDKQRELSTLRQFVNEYDTSHQKEAAGKEKDALFSESQYSGGTGGGGFVYASGLPAFTRPGLESTVQTKKAALKDVLTGIKNFGVGAGSGVVAGWMQPGLEVAKGLETKNLMHIGYGAGIGAVPALAFMAGRASKRDKQKEAGAMTPTGLSPASRLASSQRMAQPKISTPSGPSIAQVSKPIGFGKPQPGSLKGGI